MTKALLRLTPNSAGIGRNDDDDEDEGEDEGFLVTMDILKGIEEALSPSQRIKDA